MEKSRPQKKRVSIAGMYIDRASAVPIQDGPSFSKERGAGGGAGGAILHLASIGFALVRGQQARSGWCHGERSRAAARTRQAAAGPAEKGA